MPRPCGRLGLLLAALGAAACESPREGGTAAAPGIDAADPSDVASGNDVRAGGGGTGGTGPGGVPDSGTTPTAGADGPTRDAPPMEAATAPVTCATGQQACAAASGGSACVNLQTSAQHCGACGRDCAGGACLFGICQPKSIASGLTGMNFLSGGVSSDGQEIFVADWNTDDVKSVRLETGYVRSIADSGKRPHAVTLIEPHVYWAEQETNSILFYRVPKQGAGTYEPVATVTGPELVVDVGSLRLVGGALYWSRRSGTQAIVERTVPGSGQIQRVLSAPASGLRDDLQVHASGVYWTTDELPPRTIWRTPLGGGAQTEFESGNNAILRLLASDQGHLYWSADFAGGPLNAVVRKPVQGGPSATLGSAPFRPGNALTAFYKETLFLFGAHEGGVMALPLSGGGRAVEIAGTGRQWNPAGVAVDDQFVYWVSNLGALWRVVR